MLLDFRRWAIVGVVVFLMALLGGHVAFGQQGGTLVPTPDPGPAPGGQMADCAKLQAAIDAWHKGLTEWEAQLFPRQQKLAAAKEAYEIAATNLIVKELLGQPVTQAEHQNLYSLQVAYMMAKQNLLYAQRMCDEWSARWQQAKAAFKAAGC